MGCQEMSDALLDALLPIIKEGGGLLVGAALNKHPEINGNSIVPTTGKTLYDTVANMYPDNPGSPMTKAALLEGVRDHDRGMQINIPPYAQAAFDNQIQPVLSGFNCETASGTPSVAPHSPSVAGAKAPSSYRG